MNRPASPVFFSLFALVACAAAPEKPAPVAATPQAFFTYHASVASVPEGASNLVVSVRMPEQWPIGVLRPLLAYGLVGNAPFEMALVEMPDFSSSDFHNDLSMTDGPAVLRWRAGQEGGTRYRELVVETRGKPLELSLRLAQMPGAPVEASALEQGLTRGTSATLDGRPVEAVSTRLERSSAPR